MGIMRACAHFSVGPCLGLVAEGVSTWLSSTPA